MRARLDGRPLVAHVLQAARAAGLGRLVVVLGGDAAAVRADSWRPTRLPSTASLVAVNPAAGTGPGDVAPAGPGGGDRRSDARPACSSCWATSRGFAPAVIAALIGGGGAPGRPRGRRGATRATGRRTPSSSCRPRGGSSSASSRATAASVRSSPPARGASCACRSTAPNPDVDTPADLADPRREPSMPPDAQRPLPAAHAAWGARVRAHHAQTARVRETPEGGGLLRAGQPALRRRPPADRRRGPEPSAAAGAPARDVAGHRGRRRPLRPAARPARPRGRRARPVAGDARRAPRAGGRARHRQRRRDRGPLAGRPCGGASAGRRRRLIANLGYDVEAIGPFLDAMEAAAGRLCVAILADASRRGRPRVLAARPRRGAGRAAGARGVPRPAAGARADRGRSRGCRAPRAGSRRARSLTAWLRNQLFLEPGSAKDLALDREVAPHLVVNPDGTVGLAPELPMSTGIVTWEPR